MKGLLKRRLLGFRRGQKGFTLVELLVVVGIIVALAAVIIPNVAKFGSKGETGAKASERDQIQTSIDSYMADTGIGVLPGANANNLATGTSAANFGTGGVLNLVTGGYLRESTSKYFYCWDTAGFVKAQDAAATADCTRSN